MTEFESGIAQAVAVLGMEYKREKDNGDYYMNEVLPELKGEYEALQAKYNDLKQQYTRLECKYKDTRDGLLKLLTKEDNNGYQTT